MDYDTMLKIATKRRSVRKFKETSVPREDIEKIVELAMQSPSGANWQPWEMVIVENAALKNQISELLLKGIGDAKTAIGFVKATVFIILYGDTRIRPYAPPATKDDDSWWNFTFNASLNNAFMSMQYAAASLGLGSMWVSAFRNPAIAQPAQELLKIPQYFQAYEMLALGYSDIKIAKKKMRSISDVLHLNVAENYRSEKELENWFHSKKTK